MTAFTLAAYGLAAALGCLSLGVFVSIYWSGRSPLVASYLVFLGVSLLQLASSGVGILATALAPGSFRVAAWYYFSETIWCGALSYAAPRFFLEFADLPFAGKTRRLAIGAAAVVLSASPLCLAEAGSPLLFYLAPSLGLAAFLSAMVYSQVRLVGAYRSVQDRLGRIGLPALLAYDFVCFASGFVESGISSAQLASGAWPRGALLRPSLFIANGILGLVWAFRYEASGAISRPASVEPDPARGRLLGLTEREIELARLLASGAANKEIASALGLSPNTVRNHVHNIFEKTGARNRVELVRALCGADEAGPGAAS